MTERAMSLSHVEWPESVEATTQALSSMPVAYADPVPALTSRPLAVSVRKSRFPVFAALYISFVFSTLGASIFLLIAAVRVH